MGGMSRLITPVSPSTTFTFGEAAHLYSYTGEKITGSIADTFTKGGHTKAGQQPRKGPPQKTLPKWGKRKY